MLAPSGGSGEGGGGGGGGGGGFSKATLKKILQAMISKFEAHKKAQTERQEQLELQGMSPEAIVQSLQGELMQRLQVRALACARARPRANLRAPAQVRSLTRRFATRCFVPPRQRAGARVRALTASLPADDRG